MSETLLRTVLGCSVCGELCEGRGRDPKTLEVVHLGGVQEGQDQRTVPSLSAGPLHPADEEALVRKIFVKRGTGSGPWALLWG